MVGRRVIYNIGVNPGELKRDIYSGEEDERERERTRSQLNTNFL